MYPFDKNQGNERKGNYEENVLFALIFLMCWEVCVGAGVRQDVCFRFCVPLYFFFILIRRSFSLSKQSRKSRSVF